MRASHSKLAKPSSLEDPLDYPRVREMVWKAIEWTAAGGQPGGQDQARLMGRYQAQHWEPAAARLPRSGDRSLNGNDLRYAKQAAKEVGGRRVPDTAVRCVLQRARVSGERFATGWKRR